MASPWTPGDDSWQNWVMVVGYVVLLGVITWRVLKTPPRD